MYAAQVKGKSMAQHDGSVCFGENYTNTMHCIGKGAKTFHTVREASLIRELDN